MKKLIFIIFLFLPGVYTALSGGEAGWGVLFAQSEDSLYYTNPNYQVAKELFNRKIVMLGDCGHSNIGFYKRLADVLNNWLSICKENKNTINLTLVVEDDPQHVSLINKYLLSGDLKPLLDLISPDISFRNLEGYTMLLNFYKKFSLENYNRENKLSFKTVGFEQTTDSNFLYNLSRKPQKESELWFIHDRDTNLANEIINYTKQNPEEQILIFYGGFHLQNGLVNKNLGFKDIPDEESMGHCLAYYLKKQFGNSAVITFSPVDYYHANLNPLFKNSLLESKRNEEFIFKPQELVDPIYNDTVNDYIINMHEKNQPSMLGYNICSRFIFEKNIEKINIIKNSLPGYKAASEYKMYLRSAKFLTGIDFANDTELNNWAANNEYNGIDWLNSDKFTATLWNSILKVMNLEEIKFTRSPYGIPFILDYNLAKKLVEINSFLSFYGIPFNVYSDDFNFNKWKIQEFPEMIKQIKFTNSIGIYWLGYPDEQIKAKEYLVKFSGEDFAEPEKYLQWYRKKYFGYEY